LKLGFKGSVVDYSDERYNLSILKEVKKVVDFIETSMF